VTQDNFGKPSEAYIVMPMPPNVLYRLGARWARDYDWDLGSCLAVRRR